MIRIAVIFLILFSGSILYSQSDTLDAYLEKNAKAVDTLKLRVNNVVFSGNDITHDEIILREMNLKKGKLFTLKKYTEDILNIYNLGLFTKVDIIPVPLSKKEVMLNVDVQERWYILPLPSAGLDDGEWKKLWMSLNLRWDNFRGRNEQVSLYGRIFYNPSVSFSYFVPWIGNTAHLFAGFSIGYNRSRNRSFIALGGTSEGNTLTYEDQNYDNFRFSTAAKLGKYTSKRFSIYSVLGFDYLRTSLYEPGRTLNPNGKDRFFTLTFGVSYDSRNIREYPTKGYYVNTTYSRIINIDHIVGYGRYEIESQSFIPINISKNYFLTVASRVYTSIAVGPVIPLYDHQFLGYGETYIRGWRGKAYEGEAALTNYNELRIPIIAPRYIKAKDMVIAKDLPIIKNLDLRHGIFFKLIYDIGTVFDHSDNIFNKKFQSGAGVGVDVILPFGYVFRTDWVCRLNKPAVGQITLSLSSKF